jgi:protoporphyrinogen oxidase
MPKEFRHIVVGAGISGLGLAHRAVRADVPTLVLERSNQVGGCINSRRFTECGDFWTEGGSHTCFNSYGNLLDILGDLGALDRITPKSKLRYQLWRGGRRRSIFSALHILELAFSLPRLFAGAKAGRSVLEYYGAGLGRRNYEDVFGPAFRAVICQNADDFPADLLFRRKPRRKEVVRSFTFPGGLSDIPRSIAQQQGLELRTGESVASAHRRSDGGFRVLLDDGTELGCDYLTLAVPPDVAAKLLQSDWQDLSTLAERLEIAEVESLVLCIRGQDLEHLPPLAGLIAVDDAFYSAVSRDYLTDSTYRGFAFHFRPNALSRDERVERACKALGVGPEKVAAREWITNRLPALRAGHLDLVDKIDDLLAGSRLALTGNWFQGVSIEDCLTRSRREYERLFN